MITNSKKLLLSLPVIAVVLFFVYITYYVDSPELEENNFDSGLRESVMIGALMPLTGESSLHGEDRKAAAEMAVSDFNDYLKDNNANWNLKLVSEDSATSPVIALEKLTSFNDKNIHIVIGPSSSAELRNVMEYSGSNGMLLFSPSSTAPSLAIPDDMVYRLTPDDSKQGPAIASLLVSNGIDVVIQVVRADAWGEGLSAIISESFEGKGGIVAQTIMYNPESPEFSVTTLLLAKTVNDQILLHDAENIGVIMLGFSETLQFMQSASEHDILDDVAWFGSDGNDQEEIIIMDPLGVEFANKVKFTSTILSSENNEIRQDVKDRLVKQLGRVPNTYAFSTYDIVWILGLAMIDANSSNVDDLTLIIPKIASNYHGAIGNTTLNEAGDLDTSNYDVWGIRNGEWIKVGNYSSDTDSIVEISVGK